MLLDDFLFLSFTEGGNLELRENVRKEASLPVSEGESNLGSRSTCSFAQDDLFVLFLSRVGGLESCEAVLGEADPPDSEVGDLLEDTFRFLFDFLLLPCFSFRLGSVRVLEARRARGIAPDDSKNNLTTSSKPSCRGDKERSRRGDFHCASGKLAGGLLEFGYLSLISGRSSALGANL